MKPHGESVAVVASWDILTEGEDWSHEFNYLNKTENTAEYTFSVTNNSNVSAQYDFKVECPSTMLSNITMQLITPEGSTINAESSDSKIFTFQDTTLAEVGTKRSYKLRFTANFENSLVVASLENIEVKVVAKQVD